MRRHVYRKVLRSPRFDVRPYANTDTCRTARAFNQGRRAAQCPSDLADLELEIAEGAARRVMLLRRRGSNHDPVLTPLLKELQSNHELGLARRVKRKQARTIAACYL